MSPPSRNQVWGRGRGRGLAGDNPPSSRQPPSPDVTRSWNRAAWGSNSTAGPTAGSSGGWDSVWSTHNSSSVTDTPSKDNPSTSSTSWEDLMNKEAEQVESAWGSGNNTNWGNSLWNVDKTSKTLDAPKVREETGKPIGKGTPLSGGTGGGNHRVQVDIPPKARVIDKSNPEPIKDPALASRIEKDDPSLYRAKLVRYVLAFGISTIRTNSPIVVS